MKKIFDTIFIILIICILFKTLGIDIWNLFFIPLFKEFWKNITNLF